MKGKKGILLTLLCAGMVAAMVSCSNGNDDSDSSPAPTTEQSDASGGSNDSGSGGSGVTVDYKTVPLTLEFLANGTITFTNINITDTLQYSTDGGATKMDVSSTSLTVSKDDKVCLFAEGSADGTDNKLRINCSADCYVYGNVMSLRSPSDYASATTVEQWQFSSLFETNNASHIKSDTEKKLVLPATTLADHCYHKMFRDCTGLTTAPALPATTLAAHCYRSMFTSCSGLTAAPELPATTLANNCYQEMFNSCTGLTAAPALPATTLAEQCYILMFLNCTSLNSITCLATDISASNCTTEWMSGVPATGNFYKRPTSEITNEQWNAAGVPNGWTIQAANAN